LSPNQTKFSRVTVWLPNIEHYNSPTQLVKINNDDLMENS